MSKPCKGLVPNRLGGKGRRKPYLRPKSTIQYGHLEMHAVGRAEMAAPPESPFVGDGNQLAHRAFLADERRTMASLVPRHIDVECRAERVVRQRGRAAAHEARLEAAAKRNNTVEKASLLPLLPQPLQLGSVQPMEPDRGGCFGPNCRLLELRNGNVTMLSCSQVPRIRMCSGFLGCGSAT